MNSLLLGIFLLVYLAIALEHPLGVSKSASALFGAGVLWVIYSMMGSGSADNALDESVTTAARIVFFLMGAMAIVEMIDAHDGFEIITTRLRATSLVGLLWMLSLVTFFLSAILDNLTTTIVMVSMIRKIIGDPQDRLPLTAMIVIAANAGGAWSPMGDVTTTMLWIEDRVSALAIVEGVLLPSIINLLVPLLWIGLRLRGRRFEMPRPDRISGTQRATMLERNLIFFLGAGVLLMVPAFKSITHLPVFMGVLFGLGVLWIASEFVHRGKLEEDKAPFTLAHALKRIDSASIVFFLGILLAVATLEHAGILHTLADWLNRVVGRLDVIVLVLGLLSAIVDNVPLVAAAMGMYPTAQHPTDSFLWEFLAYCAGTGGSILIIGSAAGVAAMGLERIEFLWYVRRISLPAMLGYFAGAAVYVAQYHLTH
jgi:Na+/H+ antiporter NhaD/arsenite permease-like protein